jgi:hypothetical protein
MKEALDALKEAIDAESKLSKEWREKHDFDAFAFRKEILEKIRPFEEFSTGLSMLWKILLGLSAFIMSIVKGWAWVKDHVK